MPFFCGQILAPLGAVTHKQAMKYETMQIYKNTDKRQNPDLGIPLLSQSGSRKRKASYAALQSRGSVTVEAALVLPVVLFAFMVLIQIMIFMGVQLKVQSTLYRQALKTAGYSYLLNSVEGYFLEGMDTEDYRTVLDIVENGVTEGLIKNTVIDALREEFFETPWIRGGREGIHVVITPWVETGIVDVLLYYELDPVFNIFGLDGIPIVARARLRQWTGTTKVVHEKEEEQGGEGTVAYVTASGTVYHTYRDCTYISVALSSVLYKDIASKRNASGARYYPCTTCCGQLSEDTPVYISKYGDRFHQDSSCRNVYHNIREIPIEDVGSRAWCSKCRGRSEGMK